MKIAESLVELHTGNFIQQIKKLQVHLFQYNLLKLLEFINGANKKINITENRAVQALEYTF